jgi:hypothetical protein
MEKARLGQVIFRAFILGRGWSLFRFFFVFFIFFGFYPLRAIRVESLNRLIIMFFDCSTNIHGSVPRSNTMSVVTRTETEVRSRIINLIDSRMSNSPIQCETSLRQQSWVARRRHRALLTSHQPRLWRECASHPQMPGAPVAKTSSSSVATRHGAARRASRSRPPWTRWQATRKSPGGLWTSRRLAFDGSSSRSVWIWSRIIFFW